MIKASFSNNQCKVCQLCLFQSKFNKTTSLARTIQEDPSCQLLTVLNRYVRYAGVKVIEDNLHVETLPQLLTIRKGLLALTRQWKPILYNPRVVDGSFKSRKKVMYNVTFAIPHEESMDVLGEPEVDKADEYEGTAAALGDNYEVVDEKTSLLKAEGGSVHRSISTQSVYEGDDGQGPLENQGLLAEEAAASGDTGKKGNLKCIIELMVKLPCLKSFSSTDSWVCNYIVCIEYHLADGYLDFGLARRFLSASS